MNMRNNHKNKLIRRLSRDTIGTVKRGAVIQDKRDELVDEILNDEISQGLEEFEDNKDESN